MSNNRFMTEMADYHANINGKNEVDYINLNFCYA